MEIGEEEELFPRRSRVRTPKHGRRCTAPTVGILVLSLLAVLLSFQGLYNYHTSYATSTQLSSSRCSPDALAQAAVSTIDSNFNPSIGATVPSKLVDPHIASLDSLLAAWALAHFDNARARIEFTAVLESQWTSGFIPTARFPLDYDADWVGGSLLPGPSFWSGLSRTGANTTSVAALPLHSEVAMQIYALSDTDAPAHDWLEEIFPSLYRWHEYLHTARNDPSTGLAVLLHPWESGLSYKAKAWNNILNDATAAAANVSWTPPPIPESVSANPDYPGDAMFSTELFLVAGLYAWGGEAPPLVADSSFRLIDAQFNAVLMRSDQALLDMAKILDATTTSWRSHIYTPEQFAVLVGWADTARAEVLTNALWRDNMDGTDGAVLNLYVPPGADMTRSPDMTRIPIEPPTASSFSLLLSRGLPADKSQRLSQLLLGGGNSGQYGYLTFRCGGLEYPIPEEACSVDAPESFHPRAWMVDSLLAHRGLLTQGYPGVAEWLRNTSLALPCSSMSSNFTFSRSYDVANGEPYFDQYGTETTLSAAVTLLLLLADGPLPTNDLPPISHETMTIIMAFELAFTLATMLSCFLLSLTLLRRLKDGEDVLAVSPQQPNRSRRVGNGFITQSRSVSPPADRGSKRSFFHSAQGSPVTGSMYADASIHGYSTPLLYESQSQAAAGTVTLFGRLSGAVSSAVKSVWG